MDARRGQRAPVERAPSAKETIAGGSRLGAAGTAPVWILFDGRCALCDRAVSWLLRHDRRGAFRFAPLEGAAARAVRARHPALPPVDETVVVVEAPETGRERVRVRSDAALAIAVRLGGLWRLAALFRIVPPPLRDLVYRFVARRRKRWFGELVACRVPTPAERERFLG